MEGLIPFLIFIIVGILSAVGKLKKDKPSANARGRQGLVVRINAWLTDLKKRIETQSKKAPTGKLEWEQLIGRSQQARMRTMPFDDELERTDFDGVQQTPKPLPKAKPLATSPRPRMPIKPSEKPKVPAVEAPRMPKKARRKSIPTVLPVDRSGLRQAVVWSEILGPPIALRDPFRDNR